MKMADGPQSTRNSHPVLAHPTPRRILPRVVFASFEESASTMRLEEHDSTFSPIEYTNRSPFRPVEYIEHNRVFADNQVFTDNQVLAEPDRTVADAGNTTEAQEKTEGYLAKLKRLVNRLVGGLVLRRVLDLEAGPRQEAPGKKAKRRC